MTFNILYYKLTKILCHIVIEFVIINYFFIIKGSSKKSIVTIGNVYE